MSPPGVVEAFDEVEDGEAGLDLRAEAPAVEDSHSRLAKKDPAIALSQATPTEPMEGFTPASSSAWVAPSSSALTRFEAL